MPNSPSHVGRRPKDNVDKISVIVWALNIQDILGLNNAYKMRRYFAPPDLDSSLLPKNWERYLKGKSGPNPTTLAEIEGNPSLSGTSSFLKLNFWELIRKKAPSWDQINSCLLQSKPDLLGDLINPYQSKQQARECLDKISSQVILDSLWKDGSLRSLTSLFAILRYAEIMGDDEAYANVSLPVFYTLFTLLRIKPFIFARNELFSHCLNTFLANTPKHKLPLYSQRTGIDSINTEFDASIKAARKLGFKINNSKQESAFTYRLWNSGLMKHGKSTLHCSPEDTKADFKNAYLNMKNAKGSLSSRTLNLLEYIRYFKAKDVVKSLSPDSIDNLEKIEFSLEELDIQKWL